MFKSDFIRPQNVFQKFFARLFGLKKIDFMIIPTSSKIKISDVENAVVVCDPHCDSRGREACAECKKR